MVERGTFREDLYYRLAELIVRLPPLRDRQADIPLIATQLLSDELSRAGASKKLSAASLAQLELRAWPGNVRELRNVVRRAAAMAKGDIIEPDDLGPDEGQRKTSPHAPSPNSAIPEELLALPLKPAREQWNRRFEAEYVQHLLDRHGGDLEQAARSADVHLKSLQRLIRQHKLKS